VNGAQRRALREGLRAKVRNDVERARYQGGAGNRRRVYPQGSVLDNIRACATLQDIETVAGWIGLSADASPATRRKWLLAIEQKRAEIGSDA
jgi:hypothetical protein